LCGTLRQAGNINNLLSLPPHNKSKGEKDVLGITRNNNYRMACNKGRRMKKYLIVCLICSYAGFACGIWFERSTTWHDQEEWMQISQEACDARIKTIKFTCKK
jgi:hypothetical protein